MLANEEAGILCMVKCTLPALCHRATMKCYYDLRINMSLVISLI